MTEIEHFDLLDSISRRRSLTDGESAALERLVRTKRIKQHMDDKARIAKLAKESPHVLPWPVRRT